MLISTLFCLRCQYIGGLDSVLIGQLLKRIHLLRAILILKIGVTLLGLTYLSCTNILIAVIINNRLIPIYLCLLFLNLLLILLSNLWVIVVLLDLLWLFLLNPSFILRHHTFLHMLVSLLNLLLFLCLDTRLGVDFSTGLRTLLFWLERVVQIAKVVVSGLASQILDCWWDAAGCILVLTD